MAPEEKNRPSHQQGARSDRSTVQLAIDRFEEGYAVLAWGRVTFPVPRDLLPTGARAGDVLTVEFSLDREATVSLRQQVEELLAAVFAAESDAEKKAAERPGEREQHAQPQHPEEPEEG